MVVISNSTPGGLLVRNTPEAAILSAWSGGQEISVALTPAQRDQLAALLLNPAAAVFQFVGTVDELDLAHVL